MTSESSDTREKMLQEVRLKTEDFARQLATTRRDIKTCLAEKRRNELTLDEIKTVPDTQPMYRSVGRAFFSESKPDLIQGIQSRIERHQEQLRSLQEADQYLSKKVDECVEALEREVPPL